MRSERSSVTAIFLADFNWTGRAITRDLTKQTSRKRALWVAEMTYVGIEGFDSMMKASPGINTMLGTTNLVQAR